MSEIFIRQGAHFLHPNHGRPNQSFRLFLPMVLLKRPQKGSQRPQWKDCNELYSFECTSMAICPVTLVFTIVWPNCNFMNV